MGQRLADRIVILLAHWVFVQEGVATVMHSRMLLSRSTLGAAQRRSMGTGERHAVC